MILKMTVLFSRLACTHFSVSYAIRVTLTIINPVTDPVQPKLWEKINGPSKIVRILFGPNFYHFLLLMDIIKFVFW